MSVKMKSTLLKEKLCLLSNFIHFALKALSLLLMFVSFKIVPLLFKGYHFISSGELKDYLHSIWYSKRKKYLLASGVDALCLILVVVIGIQPASRMIQPLVSPLQPLKPLTEDKGKGGHEVFGFAPHWTFNRLDNVNWDVLTTLAYFGVEIGEDGNLIQDDPGYQTFKSKKATEVFKTAHSYGTRVVLTITQMDNYTIRSIMESDEAQNRTIEQSVALVKNRGIDGINIDIEYTGDPGDYYRQRFSQFVSRMTERMHQEVPNSKVTVSVYASAVKEPKIYDISAVGNSSDGVFMMAYDFAVASSENAIPTAPLYGHKEGKYWYDVSTAVEDFLTLMPADKLILGVPYYGYNYPVNSPTVKSHTGYRRGTAQTYSIAQDYVHPNMDGILDYKEGWDDHGKVSWRAYQLAETGGWRMVFIEDQKSLGIKYDFAKEKGLAGVGMWALGFDDGKSDLWGVLASKFGTKFADASVKNREIRE